MKDIVENRSRLGFSTKLKVLSLALRENGFIWTIQMGLYYLTSGFADAIYHAATRRRISKGLAGLNSVQINKVIWNNWDWRSGGKEWSISPEWEKSVIENFLRPNVPQGSSTVEVGPGGGRWTGELIARCESLKAVDISEACILLCRERFKQHSNAEFLVGSGSDLCAIPSQSVDAVWSFDVFVHVNKEEFKNYAAEFFRILRPLGRGVIHHGSIGGKNGGWRSDATTANVAEFLTGAGLKIERHISEWQDDGKLFQAGLYDDVVTIFTKPGVVASAIDQTARLWTA